LSCEQHAPGAPSGAASEHSALASLRASPMLGYLDAEDLTLLLAGCHAVKAPRGHLLARADDDTVTIVLTGAAAAALTGASGVAVITDLLGPGATWGLAGTVGHVGTNAEVKALVQTEALQLPGPALRQAILDRDTIARACLRAAAAELGAVRQEAERLAGTSVPQRVVLRLLDLAERWSEPAPDGATHITLPLSQEQLGAWARVSRESLAKVLHDLRTVGLVETGPRCIVLHDLESLRHSVEAARPNEDPIQRLLRELA
jgi:CRP/FNR family transcriptional regulator, cyclic AMP receptor protein